MLSIAGRPIIDICNTLLNIDSLRSRRRGDTWLWVVLLINLVYFALQVYLRFGTQHEPAVQPLPPLDSWHPELPPQRGGQAKRLPHDPFNSGPLEPYIPGSLKTAHREEPPNAPPTTPVVVTLLTTSSLANLERFIGSIHKWHRDWPISVTTAPPTDAAAASRVASRHNVQVQGWQALLKHVCTHPDFASTTPGSRLAALQAHAFCIQDESSKAELPDELAPISWGPLAVHMVLQVHPYALYVDNDLEVVGWNDAAFKHLLRDGALFVNDEASSACSSSVWAMGGSSNPKLPVLNVYARCMFQDGCRAAGSPDTWLSQILHQEQPGLACQPAPLLAMTRQRKETERVVGTLGRALDDDEDTQDIAAGARPQQQHTVWKEERDNVTCHLLSQAHQHVAVMLQIKAPDGWHPHEKQTARQDSSVPHDSAAPSPKAVQSPTTIAIAIPIIASAGSASRRSALETVHAMFLPALVNSIAMLSHRLRYALYIACEQDDAHMLTLDGESWKLRQAVGQAPVAITVLQIPQTGSATAAWNAAAKAAFDDGADYITLAHADTQLPQPWQSEVARGVTTWADTLLQALHSSTLEGDVGVAIPCGASIDKGKLVTHAMVHRQHVRIFGEMLPWHLRAAAALAWLSRVYGPYCTFVAACGSGASPVHARGAFSGHDLAAMLHAGAAGSVGNAMEPMCHVDSDEVDVSVRVSRQVLHAWAAESLGIAADLREAFL